MKFRRFVPLFLLFLLVLCPFYSVAEDHQTAQMLLPENFDASVDLQKAKTMKHENMIFPLLYAADISAIDGSMIDVNNNTAGLG